jgi:hypothetical protein
MHYPINFAAILVIMALLCLLVATQMSSFNLTANQKYSYVGKQINIKENTSSIAARFQHHLSTQSPFPAQW